MKKVLLSCAIALSLSTAFAQKGLHIGATVTPGTSWMFNKDDSDAGEEYNYVGTFGITGGFSTDYHFTDGVGVGFDILYSRHSQKFESYGIGFEKRNNYLKIPVLLHFNTSSESVGMFKGYIGPSFNILTNADVLDANGNSISIPGLSGLYEDGYKKMNINFVLAFGAGFNITDFLQASAMLRLEGSPFNSEEEDYFAANRAVTRNAFGGIEIGFKYVLRTGR
ncbi:MAG: outer membrane beta-barrel protein [Chitinophagales bacterium]|nr:outer membrane beta-barrel protein [Chitinophagales bacterium]